MATRTPQVKADKDPVQAVLETMADQIKQWMEKYGELHTVEHNGKLAIVRTPRMSDIEIAMKGRNAKTDGPFDYTKKLLRQCVLWNDPVFDMASGEDVAKLALLTAMGEIQEVPEAKLGKL